VTPEEALLLVGGFWALVGLVIIFAQLKRKKRAEKERT